VLNNKEYINKLYQSDKALIIYKVKNGFDIYTDLKEKIIVKNSNLKKFLNHQVKKKHSKISDLNCYIGFLGYKILCENINVHLPKQKSNNFYPGIFYRPQTIIKIRKNILIKSSLKNYRNFKIEKNKKYYHTDKFKVNINLQQYSKLFDKFSKKIKEGKTYQIKICQTYRNKAKINSIDFFWNLMKINQSPESFLIRDKDYSIISCSPETLINKKNKYITTKPIAGTLRKRKNMSKSIALNFFRKNEKESKEHNMIVDMERNDLSKICKTGSVKIKKLKKVEEFRDLYHYVTTIGGKIKSKITNHDIISALMPGGSVIGCPKISTLNLLNKSENFERSIYTGSFGLIYSNGNMRFNIIIRSILNFNNLVEISAASGVILGSKAKNEYAENAIKAKSLLDLFKL
tara:strand:+ start:3391 stop:4599 length:1209 start_codon:yes stop_codon:yes gene_type:complete